MGDIGVAACEVIHCCVGAMAEIVPGRHNAELIGSIVVRRVSRVRDEAISNDGFLTNGTDDKVHPLLQS